MAGTLKELLYKTLEELGGDDFMRFKWTLRQHGHLEGQAPLPVSRLETAERPATTDLIFNAYPHHRAQIMVNVLRSIGRNDLIKDYQEIVRGG